MNISHPGRRAPLHFAAAMIVAAFVLTGCQTVGAGAPARTSNPAPGAGTMRPAAIDPVVPADRIAEQLERERSARGFEDGCRQYVLIEHADWRVLCVDGAGD